MWFLQSMCSGCCDGAECTNNFDAEIRHISTFDSISEEMTPVSVPEMPTLRLKFKTPLNKTVDVVFTVYEFPLGIVFNSDEVAEVGEGSNSARLGVRVGWKLLEVNDLKIQDLTRSQIKAALVEASSRIIMR